MLLATAGLILAACGSTTSPTPVPAATAAALTPTPSPQPSPTPEPPPAPTATPDPTATPEPTVAPVPSPTTGAVPTPQPAASVTANTDSGGQAAPVNQVARLADETWEFLVKLTEDFSPRETATGEEKAAADYLLGLFEDIGYEAQLQPFTFERLAAERPFLTLTLPEVRDFEALPMRFGAETTATGLLVHVGLAREGDLPETGLSGKIALVHRGEITFEEKVRRIQDAGALAAVVYNNVPDLFRGDLGSQADIPAVSVSEQDGESLLTLMASGDVVATVALSFASYASRNVIAEKPGTAGDGRVVVLGAHYDTVPDTQGANDNGSGVTVMMAIAREVAGASFPFTLRFIAFGSEEVGLFGSRHYVDTLSPDEVEDIVAMLNFDVPGSGEIVQVIGSFDLANKALAYAAASGIDVMRGSPLEGAGSDHQPFDSADIPYLFFLADDLSRINSPADDIEFVKPELMGAAAAVGLGLLDALAPEQ